MKSCATTLYEAELEKQVWQRDEVIKRLIKVIEKHKEIMKETIRKTENLKPKKSDNCSSKKDCYESLNQPINIHQKSRVMKRLQRDKKKSSPS